LVVIGAGVPLAEALAFASEQRLVRPTLGVLLLRDQVEVDVLAAAIRAGLREVVPADDAAALSAADVGAAPFDTGRHASLAIDFYWSPLKVFEYMAAGLPVLAPRIERLSRLVGNGREGLLYDAADPSALADAILALRADDALLDVEATAAEPLRAHLARYVVMDQVKLEDVSAAFRVVPALGPAGVELARSRAPSGAAAWENPRRGAPALDVLLPETEAAAFREGLAAAGATPLSEEDLEALRVAGGVARWGADVDASRLPMEAALVATAVSFDKGCYLGQEVVLRGTFRGHIQKGLVQLALPPSAAPGAPLTAGGQDVGVVTSAVETPDGRLGLGYVRRAHWAEGTRLAAAGGEAVVRRLLVAERE
jgi:folate-binding protein YgfZ